MKASQLRHKIKMLQAVTTRTTTGGQKVGWQAVLALSAKVSPLSVKEFLANGATQNTATARCVIRYRTDINTEMQVEYDGQIYQIVGEPLADNGTGREYLTLLLKKVDK